MVEFKNPLGKDQAKSEEQREPTIEEKKRMIIGDLKAEIGKYNDEEIEAIAGNLSWTIEGSKREGLLGMISDEHQKLSELESLQVIIFEAIAKMKERKE